MSECVSAQRRQRRVRLAVTVCMCIGQSNRTNKNVQRRKCMCFVYSFEFSMRLVCALFLCVPCQLSNTSRMKLFIWFMNVYLCAREFRVRVMFLQPTESEENFRYWKSHNFTNQFDLRSCGVSTCVFLRKFFVILQENITKRELSKINSVFS